jgi:ACS family tartrate transporter-like MFS transporter
MNRSLAHLAPRRNPFRQSFHTVCGISASRGPFWALSTGWLSARNAAAGIAQINAIRTGCTFFTNYITGAIKDATGSWPLSLLPIAGLTAAATIIVVALGDPRRDQR